MTAACLNNITVHKTLRNMMKKYGIRITLAEDNPMRLPHLLGEDWESLHWYDTEEERDSALADMSRRLPNYREGDNLAQVFTRIER